MNFSSTNYEGCILPLMVTFIILCNSLVIYLLRQYLVYIINNNISFFSLFPFINLQTYVLSFLSFYLFLLLFSLFSIALLLDLSILNYIHSGSQLLKMRKRSRLHPSLVLDLPLPYTTGQDIVFLNIHMDGAL